MRTPFPILTVSRKHARQIGLTLTELLVVLALIGGLAALLLPAYNRAMESAKVAQDLSQLRQIGMAITLYTNDNDYIPGEQWPVTLTPEYLATWNVFKSPFDQRSPSRIVPVSYDVNVNLWGKDFLHIVSPRDCILLASLAADESPLKFASTANEPSLPSPLCRESNGVGSEGGTASNEGFIPVLFADLHGELMSITVFHSTKANPDTGSPISDLRWNE